MPITKAPIRAPNPSEDAKTPILNSDNINFSLPNTGINETNGKPKILKEWYYEMKQINREFADNLDLFPTS